MNRQIIFPNHIIDYNKVAYISYNSHTIFFGFEGHILEIPIEYKIDSVLESRIMKKTKKIYNLLLEELEFHSDKGHTFKIDFTEYLKKIEEEELLEEEIAKVDNSIQVLRARRESRKESLDKYYAEIRCLEEEIRKVIAEKKAKEAEHGLSVSYTREGALTIHKA